MNRYATNKFTGQYKATIGADVCTKDAVVTDTFGRRHYCHVQVWDTAGQERFQSLGHAFYRGADCVILVYDATDVHSLDHLEYWRREFLEHVGTIHAANFPCVVLGNKCDKVRKVPLKRAIEWCDQLPHFETSAKSAINVEEAFQEVTRLALQYEEYKKRAQPQLFIPPTEPIDLRRNDYEYSNQQQSGCC
jgi:Ras-related protein Rab-7A